MYEKLKKIYLCIGEPIRYLNAGFSSGCDIAVNFVMIMIPLTG